MSEKEPGAALAPVKLDLVDTSRIPDAGHRELVRLEELRVEAFTGFWKNTGKGFLAVGGIFAAIALAMNYPFLAFVVLAGLAAAGAAGAGIFYGLSSVFDFFALLDHGRHFLPSGRVKRAYARLEGRVRKEADAWNRQAELWNESYENLMRYEEAARKLRNRKKREAALEEVRVEKEKLAKLAEKLFRSKEAVEERIADFRSRLRFLPDEPKFLRPPDDPERD